MSSKNLLRISLVVVLLLGGMISVAYSQEKTKRNSCLKPTTLVAFTKYLQNNNNIVDTVIFNNKDWKSFTNYYKIKNKLWKNNTQVIISVLPNNPRYIRGIKMYHSYRFNSSGCVDYKLYIKSRMIKVWKESSI